jgi:hypothetical protein
MDAVREFIAAAMEGVKKENMDQPSREGSIAYTKLEDALVWRDHQTLLRQRAKMREPDGAVLKG